MTAYTQSGYPVIPAYGDPRIAKTSPVNAAPGVLDELVPIFEWVMTQFDRTVTPLIAKQCWGYAPRQIRGGTGWSNHASGTAVDLNATMFPQGKRYMSKAQIGACRNIVARSGGVIRWGGDFGGSTALDQQHFEIAPGLAGTGRVAAFAAYIESTKEIDTTMAKVTFVDANKMSSLIAGGMPSDQARKEATVTYPNQTAAQAGTLNFLSSVLRDVGAIRKKVGA